VRDCPNFSLYQRGPQSLEQSGLWLTAPASGPSNSLRGCPRIAGTVPILALHQSAAVVGAEWVSSRLAPLRCDFSDNLEHSFLSPIHFYVNAFRRSQQNKGLRQKLRVCRTNRMNRWRIICRPFRAWRLSRFFPSIRNCLVFEATWTAPFPRQRGQPLITDAALAALSSGRSASERRGCPDLRFAA
jgi:hypothetical protein